MSEKRAVVTGIGIVSPIGIGAKAFWEAAVAGTNGIRPIRSFDTSGFRTRVGAEVQNFDPTQFVNSDQLAGMDRSSQFAVAASCMAVAESGLEAGKENPFRLSVVLGTTMGEPQVLERGIEIKFKHGEHEIPRRLPGEYPCGVISANVARRFGIKGCVAMIPAACAAGNYALGYAFDLIKLDKADVVIAGGSDPLSKIAFTGFNRLLATAKERCAPFDKNRDGMAVGEGAGILVVEEREHALRRNAAIYAEILGYGLACDAYKMTIPDPAGVGGIIAFRRALECAGISAADVDYISAHGTGTSENDSIETLIIKESLGARAHQVPVSSLKSMIGHTMGAASAIEAAACALMIQRGVILPTINYREPDPECDLDYVPNAARQLRAEVIVSNAYAFGGNASSIVIGRYNG